MKRRTFFAGFAALVVAPAVAMGLKKKEIGNGIVPKFQNNSPTLDSPDSPYPANLSKFATINTVEEDGHVVHITLTNDRPFIPIPKAGDFACFEDEEVGYVKNVGPDYRISIMPFRANILLRVKSAVPGTSVAFYGRHFPER